MSKLWHDVELGGSPQRISQPLRARYGAELNYTLQGMPQPGPRSSNLQRFLINLRLGRYCFSPGNGRLHFTATKMRRSEGIYPGLTIVIQVQCKKFIHPIPCIPQDMFAREVMEFSRVHHE